MNQSDDIVLVDRVGVNLGTIDKIVERNKRYKIEGISSSKAGHIYYIESYHTYHSFKIAVISKKSLELKGSNHPS